MYEEPKYSFAILKPGKSLPAPTGQGTRAGPNATADIVEKKSFAHPIESRFIASPARSLVTISAELSSLLNKITVNSLAAAFINGYRGLIP
jgi:hypothetical protein